MKSHSGQTEHVDTKLNAQARALPWWARLLLIRPARVAAHLALVHRTEIVERPPNMWQVVLGALRMWSRVLFRFNSSAERLLGWSYVDSFGVQLGTPSYFLLERDCPLTHRRSPN